MFKIDSRQVDPFHQLPLEAMKIVTLFALSAAVKFRVHPTADDEWL